MYYSRLNEERQNMKEKREKMYLHTSICDWELQLVAMPNVSHLLYLKHPDDRIGSDQIRPD